MIFTDRTITVRKGESRIDEPIVVYRGDYELEVRFTILNSRFKFMSGTNMIESEKASYGQLAILTPYGGNIFSDIVRCNDGSVTFVLTAEMLNQIEEVGLYSFQIRLMDYNKESRVSIPPIEFGIEVREPIASEDHDNSVNNAIVGYSIAKVVDPKEGKVGDTFDEDGNYNKTKWETGDRISQGKLNKIEDAIDRINQNEKKDSASLSKRIDNNFNILETMKADTTDVDSLQTQINDLVLGAVGDGNNAEVVQARGGYKTLNSRLGVMEQPVDLDDVTQGVLNMLNKTSYLVLCPPIKNWEFDGQTLRIRDISKIYVYIGAKGYYHRINVVPEGITVTTDQIAYVDLSLDEPVISVVDSPYSAGIHGVNAFVDDNKLPLVINLNGLLSGPLVDKLLPSLGSVGLDDVNQGVLNMLNKTSYLVLCHPIRNWEFDGQTLRIRDISRIYVYMGAKGYYHRINVDPEGITVATDQMAYVDLSLDEPVISVVNSPYSAGIHGANAFIDDNKLPLVINLNGLLSGPLVDKLLPSSSESEGDSYCQPGIWYKMSEGDIFFNNDTRTLSWTCSLLYLDSPGLPPDGEQQRIKIASGSFTFPEGHDTYAACYLDLNSVTSTQENDPSICIKGGSYTLDPTNGYRGLPGQIPIAKYDIRDGGFSVINFPKVNIINNTSDPETNTDPTIIDSRLYINVTSNSKVTIFKQSGEKSGAYYIGQDFVHSYSPTINSDVWRLDTAYIYTKNENNSFTKFTQSPIINGGEWECALKEVGATDFMGGIAHGDEIMTDVIFLLDGSPIDLSSNGSYTGNKINILENSVLNRVDIPDDKVAKHVRYYEITNDDIIITQKVEWLQSLTMDKSYLTMLPIARTVGSTEDGEYITNKGFKNNYFKVLDLSYGHHNKAYENGVSEAVIWNDGVGYKVFAKVEVLESNELPNANMGFSNSSNYNKIYFDYCGYEYKTTVGEIWNNKARYIIDYYGYVSDYYQRYGNGAYDTRTIGFG